MNRLGEAYLPLVSTITILAGLATYVVQRFTTRVSPTIPYVGGNSLVARLSAAELFGRNPVELLKRSRELYGDAFCIDLILFKIVFFLGSENNKRVLRASEDELSFIESVKWALGPRIDGLYDNPDWVAKGTKVMKTSLFSQDRISAQLKSIENITEEHFEQWSKRDAIPLFESISHLVISQLLVIMMGEDFYRRHGEELVPMMASFERNLQKPILRLLPGWLWHFSTPGAELQRSTERFNELVTQELKSLMANPDPNRTDYFASIVHHLGDEHAQYYPCHIRSMVFGGHANVGLTIPWMFLHARRTSGALDRIREEAVLPRDAKKSYMEACLRETGRLYTNVQMLRIAKRTATIGEHTVPAGTILAISPVATQRAEDWDTGAERWDPERFFDQEQYRSRFQKAEFVQFGLGMHACPGEKLARSLVMDCIWRIWMEKYDVDVISGLKEGLLGVDGVGVEAAWTEENFGTPSVRGQDVTVRVQRRS